MPAPAWRVSPLQQLGEPFPHLRVEEEEPGDPQFQGQGPFLGQGLPVVEEDEVGAALPAHVGEIPGAQVGGEKHGGF